MFGIDLALLASVILTALVIAALLKLAATVSELESAREAVASYKKAADTAQDERDAAQREVDELTEEIAPLRAFHEKTINQRKRASQAAVAARQKKVRTPSPAPVAKPTSKTKRSGRG